MLEFLKPNGRTPDRVTDTDSEAAPATGRPSIGLALGGGAARGFAHIGVIRTTPCATALPDDTGCAACSAPSATSNAGCSARPTVPAFSP